MYLSSIACIRAMCTVRGHTSVRGAGVTSDRRLGIILCADATDSPGKPGYEVIVPGARHRPGAATMSRVTVPLAEWRGSSDAHCVNWCRGSKGLLDGDCCIQTCASSHRRTSSDLCIVATAEIHRIHKR